VLAGFVGGLKLLSQAGLSYPPIEALEPGIPVDSPHDRHAAGRISCGRRALAMKLLDLVERGCRVQGIHELLQFYKRRNRNQRRQHRLLNYAMGQFSCKVLRQIIATAP
jgi:hypothetical protein